MKTLSKNPSLEFLRREARTLKSRHRAKDISVCGAIGHFDTSFHGLSDEEVFSRKFSVLDAQRVTARQYSFASWRRLKLFVQKSTQETSDYDPILRKMLLNRNMKREALLKRVTRKKPNAKKRFDEFNQESQEMLKGVYKQYGWPGPQIVGRDGAEACFWLGLACSSNSEFQHDSAMLLKDSLPKGEFYGVPYAFTIDRWLNLSYKPTLYGSFNDFNVESGCVENTSNVVDRANLNIRRAEVGLPNFEKENQELRKRAEDQNWPKCGQEEWGKMKRQWALEGGYIEA